MIHNINNDTTHQDAEKLQSPISAADAARSTIIQAIDQALGPIPTDIGDLSNWARDMVNPMINLLDEALLPPSALAAWTIGNQILMANETNEIEHEPGRHAGYLFLLTAMIDAPEAVTAALRCLRDQLMAADPMLHMLPGITKDEEAMRRWARKDDLVRISLREEIIGELLADLDANRR